MENNLASSSASQMDVMHRRPSLSLLLSALGYTSLGYSPANGPPGMQLAVPSSNLATPQMQNARIVQRPHPVWMGQGTTGVWVEQQLAGAPAGAAPGPLKDDGAEAGAHAADSTHDDDDDDDDDDELIPTAIVIKNIPFAIKKEQLLDVMTKLNLPLPYAFNYHFDNGVFRGLAFANFTLTDETLLVVNQLNGREIGGRKLRVEYKKMLPLQERERIEREKREKRGQLEEQHRSTLNALLALLLLAALTTAATKNLSVNGAPLALTTERVYLQLPVTPAFAHPQPMELNFNDPETLELFAQLVVYRDDIAKQVFELAIAAQGLLIPQRKVLTALCQYLNLLELFDNGYIIVRRKPGYVALLVGNQLPGTLAQPPAPLHSSLMMNLNQLTAMPAPAPAAPQAPPAHPELLRLQLQLALPMPRATALRNQLTTPIQQQHFPQYQGHQPLGGAAPPQAPILRAPAGAPHQLYQQPALNGARAAAAARLYVDMRGTPPLLTELPTPGQPQALFTLGLGQLSQPGTPLGHPDISSRFQPFGHHVNGSLTNLSQGAPSSTLAASQGEYDLLGNKFSSSLNLGPTFDGNLGIWGPK